MENHESIGQALKNLLDNTFKSADVLQPPPADYIIFNENVNGENHWIVLILFFGKNNLLESLKNGTCYQLHDYLWKQLQTQKEFENIQSIILFEYSDFSEDEDDGDLILERARSKVEKSFGTSLEDQAKGCYLCGHNFDDHQLLGQIDKELGYPTEGWMVCPEEGCDCFRTWSKE